MSFAPSEPTVVSFGEDVLERMVLAVENVRQRLRRAAAALESAQIPYAVIGGNAVAAWVSKVDPAAARNTVDVDLMVNRSDFLAVQQALSNAGFHYVELLGVPTFLDGPEGRPREAVHILFAGEKVKPQYVESAPDLTITDRHEAFRVIGLEQLVRMKLTSFRRKDQVHLQDMIELGLIDRSWLDRLPTELAAHLLELIDSPDG